MTQLKTNYTTKDLYPSLSIGRNIIVPEWVSDTQTFNKWIGYPIHPKLKHETEIFPFQIRVADKIKKNKHTIINKFTGSGMTELIPRIALELAITEKPFFKQIAIITGTRMKFTEDVIQSRIKPIIQVKHPDWIQSIVKARINLVNGYYIQGYPTEHIDAIRGQDDLFFIFIDEAGFFHPNMQEQLRMAIERYIIKTNPYIIWNSTPNGPEGAYYGIYQDARALKNDYQVIDIPYTDGIQTNLITKEEIAKAQKENPRMWQQEYDNQFIAPLGALTEEPQYIDDKEILL